MEGLVNLLAVSISGITVGRSIAGVAGVARSVGRVGQRRGISVAG